VQRGRHDCTVVGTEFRKRQLGTQRLIKLSCFKKLRGKISSDTQTEANNASGYSNTF